MEDVCIADAFKRARFFVDLDDALESLRGSYSNKAHVVARLQTSPLFELGKDYIISKPPLSKHKYFLSVSCIARLRSERGKILREASPKHSSKGVQTDSQRQESELSIMQQLIAAVKEASRAGVQQKGFALEERCRDSGILEQELASSLVEILKQGDGRQERLSASLAKAKEDARLLQHKVKQKNEQLRKVWKERDQLKADLKQLRASAGEKLDNFDRCKRGMWHKKPLQCGKEFRWPSAAVAAKLDDAVRREG
jgi:hypothetical protein